MSFSKPSATPPLDVTPTLEAIDIVNKILGLEEFTNPWSSSHRAAYFLPIDDLPSRGRLTPLLFNFDFGREKDLFYWHRIARDNLIEGSTLDKTLMRFRKVTKNDLNKVYNVKKIPFTPEAFVEFSKSVKRSVRKLLKAYNIPLTDHNVGTFVILACSIIENEYGTQRILSNESRILYYMSRNFSLSLIVNLCWNNSLSEADHQTIMTDFKDAPEEWVFEVFGSRFPLATEAVNF